MPNILDPSTDLGIGDNTTIADFWAWALSDLLDNANRGVFAEFIVGQALGCLFDSPRQSWDEFDLRTPAGIRVEVKTTGRYQSWGTKTVRSGFTGLRGKALTPDGSRYHGEQVVRADVFVFCYHTGKNPLSVEEWEFYVVSAAIVDALNQKTISLSRVKKIAQRDSFHDLQDTVDQLLSEQLPTPAPDL